jgi:hypothetical protein
MEMQVVDALPGIGAGIHRDPVARLSHSRLVRHAIAGQQYAAEYVGVRLVGVPQGSNVLPGDHKDVDGCLGVDVVESHDRVILVNDIGPHEALCHFTKDAGVNNLRTAAWSAHKRLPDQCLQPL